MKRSTKYKISSFLCLGIILIGYNQCMNPMAPTGSKSAMKFSKNTLGSASTSNNSNSGVISSAEIRAISIEAFKTTVYPITRARCVSCHGASQTPLHASSNAETAHNALVDTFKVDFNNIPNSRLVLKLRNDRHNCWGDCNANAAEIQTQITEWKTQIDEKAPDATETTGAVTGKVTAESNTVQSILNPTGGNDQGTITLMAESGSLRAPMVKATEGTTAYIWAPEGNGTKTLTSTDAGLVYLNFKVTASDFYKVYMLVNAPDANSDSAFVKVAGSDSKEWHIRMTRGFEWREVTTTMNYLETPFYITGGAASVLEIRQRDDGLKISKIVITNDPAFNPTATKSMKATVSLSLAEISGVAGAMMDLDIEDYDMYSYKVTNPRIRTNRDIFVKGVKVLVNGSFNPQHSTYTIVDKKVSATDGVLSTYTMILLKDKGADLDRLSFNFDHIGTSEAGAVVPPVTTPTTPTPPVTKLTSVAGFQQTLWPVLRARCIGCHGEFQPPLHAHANVTTAHTNVVESGLVNFTNIPLSRISQKLKVSRHNCWSDCNTNAAEVEGQITIWKNLSGK